MADYNKVLLIGRLTQDLELRFTPSGTPVTDIRLATSRNFTTKDGDRREETLFIDVTVWGRQAENCCQYLRKGRQVFVEGYLKMDSWEDKNTGDRRTKYGVVAERVQFLDGPQRSDDNSGPPPSRSSSYDDYGSPEPRRSSPSPASAAPDPVASYDPPPPTDDEDPEADIPF